MNAQQQAAFLLAALLCCSVATTPAAAAPKRPPKSNVCVPASYEIQYRVRQNKYVDRFANAIVKKVQSDITRELRQRKVILLCSPVGYRLLKGCFHALRKDGRRITLGVFQFAYKVQYRCRSGQHKHFRVVSWATTNRQGKVLRGKADIKLLPKARW